MQCGPWGLEGETDFLYHNKGDGTFEEVSVKAGVHDDIGYYGLGVMWADYDDDGCPDLLVANDSVPNYLYHNNHNGTFTDVGLLSGVALSGEGLELGNMGVDFGDYDHSGRLSFFVTHFEEQPNSLYRNLGDGRFEDVTARAGLGGDELGEFGTLVNPGAPVPPFITVLTGITEAMLAPAPPLAEVLPAFLDFAQGTVCVAHNAPYDVGFLRAARATSFAEFARCFEQWPALPLNVLYADAGGTTGYQLVGQVPRRIRARQPSGSTRGRLPVMPPPVTWAMACTCSRTGSTAFT